MLLTLRWLALRPGLLRRAVQSIVSARRRCIARDLVTALTRGSPSQGIPPIDARLHDSAGYVSDVLAWVRGRLVEERETVFAPLGLLRVGEQADATGTACPDAGEKESASTSLAKRGATNAKIPLPSEVAPASLDDVAAAIAQPVRVRLQQAVEAAGDGLAAYRILDSLALYRGMLTAPAEGEGNSQGMDSESK